MVEEVVLGSCSATGGGNGDVSGSHDTSRRVTQECMVKRSYVWSN